MVPNLLPCFKIRQIVAQHSSTNGIRVTEGPPIYCRMPDKWTDTQTGPILYPRPLTQEGISNKGSESL